MNTVRRTYRLDEVADEIRRAGFITCAELAYKFDASVRTIQRDVRRIKQEYPQIYFKRGNGGGIGWRESEDEDETD